MTHHNKSTVDDQFMESCAIMNSIVVDRQSSSLMVEEETRRVTRSRIKPRDRTKTLDPNMIKQIDE